MAPNPRQNQQQRPADKARAAATKPVTVEDALKTKAPGTIVPAGVEVPPPEPTPPVDAEAPAGKQCQASNGGVQCELEEGHTGGHRAKFNVDDLEAVDPAEDAKLNAELDGDDADEADAALSDLAKMQAEPQKAGAGGKPISPLDAEVPPERERVLVRNATDSLAHIALPQFDSINKVTGHTTTRQHSSFTLLPGLNAVSKTDWTKAKEQKMVQVLLREGHYHELSAIGLKQASSKTALKMVDQTVQRSLLEEWLKTENRPEVRKAIKTRIAKIEEQKNPKAEE